LCLHCSTLSLVLRAWQQSTLTQPPLLSVAQQQQPRLASPPMQAARLPCRRRQRRKWWRIQLSIPMPILMTRPMPSKHPWQRVLRSANPLARFSWALFHSWRALSIELPALPPPLRSHLPKPRLKISTCSVKAGKSGSSWRFPCRGQVGLSKVRALMVFPTSQCV
jgi:hypothetical protein